MIAAALLAEFVADAKRRREDPDVVLLALHFGCAVNALTALGVPIDVIQSALRGEIVECARCGELIMDFEPCACSAPRGESARDESAPRGESAAEEGCPVCGAAIVEYADRISCSWSRCSWAGAQTGAA